MFLLSLACGSFQFVFIAFNPLKRFSCGFLLVVCKEIFDFCCLLRVALPFPLAFVSQFASFLMRFAFHLALCVRLSDRGQKKAPEVQKKMSRGWKKDLGFATKCFAEEKTGWQIPGTRGLLGLSEGATPPIRGHNFQSTRVATGAFWAGPRGRPRQPACPALSPGLETRKVVLCRLSSNPYRVREAKCLLGALTSRRAAGTGREDPQPDNNPFQLRFTVTRTFCAKLRREAESEKAPWRGVGG